MHTFENEEFTSFYDDGGNVYEDLHFKRCTFISSSISITEEPANRTTVRNVTLERCRVVGSALHCAVVEDVLVDGLEPSSRPFQSILDSAILPEWGNRATETVTIRVPSGRTVYEGRTAPQGGLVGGGDQTVITEVDRAWEVGP
jgi:hypothetical protein